MKLISIVFSLKNEEENIDELVNRVSNVFKKIKKYNYELIFVNDSSDDNTEQILINLQKEHPIIILNTSRTFGGGACVIAGFSHAKGDAVVYMDSDLQDPPELIEKLLLEFEKGFDVVHTVRDKRLGETKSRLFFTNLAYKIISWFADISLPINSGDFKLISRRALDKILENKEYKPYVRGLSVWVGFNQTKVHYIREPRTRGKSKAKLLSIPVIEDFLVGLMAYSVKPLYFSIAFGFFSFLISIVLIIYVLYLKFNNLTAFGSASILIFISFFSGVILFSLGILGLYVARIYEQVIDRKKYIIKEVKEFKDKV